MEGITIHGAYVIRKEKNKYSLDVISPYEALYCSVFGVQADTLSYSQDGMCRRMFDELIEKLNYRERTVISELYGYGRERRSISDIAAELECDTDEVDRLKDSLGIRITTYIWRRDGTLEMTLRTQRMSWITRGSFRLRYSDIFQGRTQI